VGQIGYNFGNTTSSLWGLKLTDDDSSCTGSSLNHPLA
jgi:hypothetical protein